MPPEVSQSMTADAGATGAKREQSAKRGVKNQTSSILKVHGSTAPGDEKRHKNRQSFSAYKRIR